MSSRNSITWEQAVAWLLSQPDQAELCFSCYFDRPALAAAERFHASSEWAAVRQLMPMSVGSALDVGAGMGIASFALAKDGWKTTALEPDPSKLVGAGAIEQLAIEARLDIRIERNWGEEIPFESNSFEFVHARQVLHHARNLPLFCKELHRVLKPGGILLASREHVISSQAQLPLFLERHPLQDLYGGENAYTLVQYKDALKDAGLSIVKTLGPLDSVINYAPFTSDTLVQEIANRLSSIPGSKALVQLLFAKQWRNSMLSVASSFDRRPGRLFSFVSMKPS
jgi:SAM-dependent methyltransferase